jgi:hypothetical protein
MIGDGGSQRLLTNFSYLGLFSWSFFFLLAIFTELYLRYGNTKLTNKNIKGSLLIINVVNKSIINLRIIIAFYCIILIIISLTDSSHNPHFREDTLLITVFIAIYFWVLIVKRFFKKLIEKSGQITPLDDEIHGEISSVIKASKTSAITNLLPLVILLIFFCLAPWPQTLYRLGFAWGSVLAVIILSLWFSWKGYFIGLFFNFMLLGFIPISYILSNINLPRHSALVFVLLVFLIFFYILAPFISFNFLKGREMIDSPVSPKYYWVALNICILSVILILYSGLQFLIWQVIGWCIMIIGLHLSEVKQKAVFNFLRDCLIEKGYQSNIRRKTVLVIFISFLLISTLFEALRGIWLFWALTACWMSLLFTFFWKFWRYAFQKS